MKIVKRIALLLIVAVASPGCTAFGKLDTWGVVTAGRDGWQHPDQVIETLEIELGSRVAEIGAGDGYWIARLSQAVGPQGRVYAVEVEDDKIEALERRVADEELSNVVVVRGGYDDPNLPDGEIDLAMTCLTYHHIEKRPAYFARLRVDLAPGARVAHLDDRHDAPPPFRWLQGNGHWSVPEELHAEMEEAGYRRTGAYDFLPIQSFQVFVLKEASQEPAERVELSNREEPRP